MMDLNWINENKKSLMNAALIKVAIWTDLENLEKDNSTEIPLVYNTELILITIKHTNNSQQWWWHVPLILALGR